MQPGGTPGFGVCKLPTLRQLRRPPQRLLEGLSRMDKNKRKSRNSKFEKNISFGDAIKIVEQRIQTNTTQSSGSYSYAKVTASANKQASTSHIPPPKHVQSIETQTDLTWPTNSEKPFHCKATATVQTDPSEHSALKQASGSLTSLSPTIPAPIAATVAGGGLPPQVGAKPTSPPAIASHLKKSSPVAPGDKSKPGPACSKGPDKQPLKTNVRPPQGSWKPCKTGQQIQLVGRNGHGLGWSAKL